MRIHSITIANFAGVERARLNDIPDTGVIVLSGPNEAGKTTLMQAVRHALLTKHTTTREALSRALIPYGRDVGPEVWLEFSLDGTRATLHKRFFKQRLCELTLSGSRTGSFAGREAEDKLEELLTALDPNLREALFVEQGEAEASFAGSEIQALWQALDKAAGEDTSAAEASGLLSAVEKELERYYSLKTLKPREELKDALAQRDAAQLRYDAAAEKLRSYEDTLEQHERCERQLRSFKQQRPEAEARLKEVEAKLKVAEEVSERLLQAFSARDAAASAHELAQEKLSGRLQLEEALADARRRREEKETGLEAAAERAEEESTRREQARALLREAEEKQSTCQRRFKEAQCQLDAVRAKERAVVLEEKIGGVEKLDQRRAQLVQPKHVSEEDIARLDQAQTELIAAQAVFDATATKVRMQAPNEQEVGRDGETLTVGPEAQEFVLSEATTLRIGEVSVELVPGTVDASVRLDSARRTWDLRREELSCESVEAARRAREEYREYEQESQRIMKERAALLGASSLDDVKQEWERLLQAFRNTPDLEDVSLPDAEEAFAAAQEALDGAQEEVAGRRQAFEAVDRNDAEVAHTMLRAEIGQLRDVEKDREERLQQALSAHSTASLQEALENAERDLALCTRSVQQAETESKEHDLTLATANAEAVRARVGNIDAGMRDAESRREGIEASIGNLAGVSEEYEQAHANLEMSSTRLAATQRRADAARLLYQTLSKHREDARKKFVAPFQAELSKLAAPVFGRDVSFEFGEKLEVTERIVDGAAIGVENLSGGAREQLGILARFAVAALAGTEGASVPVFFDDVLGASDEERLMKIGSVFNTLGKTQQIFVLTCMPQRFHYVANATMIDMDEVKG